MFDISFEEFRGYTNGLLKYYVKVLLLKSKHMPLRFVLLYLPNQKRAQKFAVKSEYRRQRGIVKTFTHATDDVYFYSN